MTTRAHRRYTAAAVALALPALAACGSSGGSGGAAGAGTPAATTAAPAATLEAAAYVITNSPALAGFTAKPADESSDPVGNKIHACLVGATGTSGTPTGPAQADSQDFTLQQTGEDASSSAEIHTTAEVAKDVRIVRSGAYLTAANRCLDSVLGAGRKLDLGADGTATVAPLAAVAAPSAPDVIGAFRLTVNVTSSSGPVAVVTDDVLQARGRVESDLAVQKANGTPDPALTKALAAQLGTKLARQ